MDADRKLRALAAAWGLALGVVLAGLAVSTTRESKVAATAITADGMMVGYHSNRAKCIEAATMLEDGAASVQISTPWGEMFDAVRITCDGSDPRKVVAKVER